MQAHRLIFLDTETTGLEPVEEHRIIEIGCWEMLTRGVAEQNRRWLLNPERDISAEATGVHGFSNADLAGQPCFADIVEEFLEFIRAGELVIHNACFDAGFLNAELERAGRPERIESHCSRIIDSLTLARELHPGQRNSLSALCKRYGVDASAREAGHGALLDAQLLMQVYLAMTSGQLSIDMHGTDATDEHHPGRNSRLPAERPPLPVIAPTPEEKADHERILGAIASLGDSAATRDS